MHQDANKNFESSVFGLSGLAKKPYDEIKEPSAKMIEKQRTTEICK